MKCIKLLMSAFNLWILGLFLNLYNTVLSKFLKKDSSLSKSHIVFFSKLYERYIELWQRQEKKHILLITKLYMNI